MKTISFKAFAFKCLVTLPNFTWLKIPKLVLKDSHEVFGLC